MAVIRVTQWLGENRAAQPKLLPDGQATVSLNHKPGRGDLRPWKAPVTVATIPNGRKTIYRMGRDTTTDTVYWHSWTTAVHAVRGFNPEDTIERTYYSGSGAPKVISNLSLDGTDPQDNPINSRLLGVPAPTTAPTLSDVAEGVSSTNVSYVYVYTFVNTYGEESAPSPVSVLQTRKQDSTATISAFDTPPGTYETVDKIRIYRSQSGSSTTDFFFLREITVGTSTTTDDNRALGETLPTTDWVVPPTDLSHLTALWNGMLAGISGKSVRFCEPYVPYAWPPQYDVLPPDSTPVALGVFGQALLVLTTGRPLLVQGSSPDSMDQQLLEIPQSCISARSVASMGTGVCWASPDGLCYYGQGGAKIVTAGLMTREDWQALKPETIIGSFHEGLYFGSYSLDGGATYKAFVVSPMAPEGLYFLSTGYVSSYHDSYLDQLYVLDGTSVQKWDAGSTMTATYRSKTFALPAPTNFGCAQVMASAFPVTLRVYADGALKHTQTVTSHRPFRLPSGFLADDWYFEVDCTDGVQSVALATSMSELTQV